MDRLWTPWRYNYVSGADKRESGLRRGVPSALAAWPEPGNGCVFCNLLGSVRWASTQPAFGPQAAAHAGLVVAQLETCFICLNAFPYSSGHVLIVPHQHLDSLAALPVPAAAELIHAAQRMESVLRSVYQPDGINLGMNLGQAAGAGVAEHLHLHVLPRWSGDSNFLSVIAETRVLPETLDITWQRLHHAWSTL
jgi:ATP adenylyltransferase